MSVNTTIKKEDINAYFKKASIKLDLKFDPVPESMVFKLNDDGTDTLVVGYLSDGADENSYGCCVGEFELHHGSFEFIGGEDHWDYIGYESAMETLKDNYMKYTVDVPKYEPSRSVEAEDTLSA
jgi:hypothetical protein